MHHLTHQVLQGNKRAAAKLMRGVEANLPHAKECLKELFPHSQQAQVIGITGPPGSGKSTITNRLITAFRQSGKTVGVIAVDPSSPFTAGAVLGDRVRMQEHAGDSGVFIRSLASRGALGGLSLATSGMTRILAAYGCERIIIETVGVGQAEVEIMYHADTVLIVTPPGAGDHIQMIKSGILEIGDIYIVNKTDLSGSLHTIRNIKQMLHMRKQGISAWQAPVLPTVATLNQGIKEVGKAIEEHILTLRTTTISTTKEHKRIDLLLRNELESQLNSFLSKPSTEQEIQKKLSVKADHYTIAEEMLQTYLSSLKNPE